MSEQMSHFDAQNGGSVRASSEDRMPSQSPIELTPDTNAATTEPGALVENEAYIKQLGSSHEHDDPALFPNPSPKYATSGSDSYEYTPTSPSSSLHPLSGTAHADSSGVVSGFTSPPSSALLSDPLEKAVYNPLEASEFALPDYVAPSRGSKRFREASDSDDEDDEPPTKRRTARSFGASPSDDDVVHSQVVKKSQEASHSDSDSEDDQPLAKLRAARLSRASASQDDAARSQILKMSRDASGDTDDEDESPTKHRTARVSGTSTSQDEVPRPQGLKTSQATSNSSDEDDEPPTKHRTGRVSGTSTSQDDVATPSEHTSSNRKRSHTAMAEEEEEDEDELPRRKRLMPAQKPQESYLHRLPGELRNRIYQHVGLIGARLELQNFEEPALAAAIPDLKDELHSFMMSANKLRVPVYSGFRHDLKPGAVEKKKRVKKPSKKSSKPEESADVNDPSTAPGTVGIDPDSWVMHADPSFVTIKHICLRVLESHVSASGHKHLCDYFLNVSCKDGNMTATGRTMMEASNVLKRTINHMACLATERAKQCAQKDGFEGFTWEQVQYIASSFVSVADARSRYKKKNAKVTLLEGMN